MGFCYYGLSEYVCNYSLALLNILNTVSTICLLMAMVALGLNVAFKDLKNRALKPLMTIIITSICLSSLAFIVVHWLYS
ncbi:putative sulfate exporter family transporter [Staphylococcus aureus]